MNFKTDYNTNEQILPKKGDLVSLTDIKTPVPYIYERNDSTGNKSYSIVSFISIENDGKSKFSYISGSNDGFSGDIIKDGKGNPAKDWSGNIKYNKELIVKNISSSDADSPSFYKIIGINEYNGGRTRKNKRKTRKFRKSRKSRKSRKNRK
jgi:hypothetical protein